MEGPWRVGLMVRLLEDRRDLVEVEGEWEGAWRRGWLGCKSVGAEEHRLFKGLGLGPLPEPEAVL